MRRHRLARGRFLLSFICLLLVAFGVAPGRRAAADDSIFDFVGPRADQVGAYAPGAGAVVSGGVGTLLPRAGWLDEAWSYRRVLTVQNGGAAVLTEWPVALSLAAATDAAANDVFMRALPSGADLRVALGGVALTRLSFGPWDPVLADGTVWFQAPTLAVGANALELYYGNFGAAVVDDPLAVFSYSAPYASRFALEPAGAPLVLASQAGANAWSSGGAAGTLAAGALTTVAAIDWIAGQAIAAAAPLEVVFDTDAGVEAAPLAFAAPFHEIVVNRGTPSHLTLLSPLADTMVAVSVDGVAAATVPLTAGAAGTYEAALAADAIVTFAAAAPILVAYRGIDLVDSYVLAPPATELWGVRSGTPRLHAVGGAATVTVYDSTGATQTVTVPAGGFTALTAGGSGTGEALRLIATQPITVVANGDGDGGDAMTFHPRGELGRSWVVPTAGRFVLVATTGVGTVCTLVPPDGSAPTSVAASVTIPPPAPGRVMFGATTGAAIQAGSLVMCDAPGFAYYEDATTDDERNLYPMEAHRKRALVDPVATLDGPRVTRYPAGIAQVIDTPELVAPTGVLGWNDLRDAVNTPAGTNVSYSLSIDGGATWLVPSAGAWLPVADPTLGTTAGDLAAALATLPTNTGRLRVRAILRSVDGVTRPSIDAVRVFYQAAGAADALAWAPLPGQLTPGLGVPTTITAVDAAGVPLTGLTGTITLTASHGGGVRPATVELVAGRADFAVAVDGVADDVRVHAVGPGGIAGDSSSFDLIAPTGSTLVAVAGDGQFGSAGDWLGAPLVVRANDAVGNPLADVQVTFSIRVGFGLLAPGDVPTTAVTTNATGEASVWVRLGAAPGALQVRAEALGQIVDFGARGDAPGATPPDDAGGCGCRTARTTAPRPAVPALAGLLGLMLWLLVRCRRTTRRP